MNELARLRRIDPPAGEAADLEALCTHALELMLTSRGNPCPDLMMIASFVGIRGAAHFIITTHPAEVAGIVDRHVYERMGDRSHRSLQRVRLLPDSREPAPLALRFCPFESKRRR